MESLLPFPGVHKTWGLMYCLENTVAPTYKSSWPLLTSLRAVGSVGPMTCLGWGIFADTQGLDSSGTSWPGPSELLASPSLLVPALGDFSMPPSMARATYSLVGLIMARL